MTKISAYPEIAVPTTDDLLIGTDVETQNQTKNFSIQSVIDLVTLQQVVDSGNTIVVPTTVSDGIDITLSNSSTVHQNGISVTIPAQTGEYPTYQPAPDAFVANINGQTPGALTGSVVGFLASATGDDNVAFFADLTATSGTSRGYEVNSFDAHTGDYFKARKYVLGADSVVFKVANNGDTTAKSFIKTGGTSAQFLMANGSTSTTPTLQQIVDAGNFSENAILIDIASAGNLGPAVSGIAGEDTGVYGQSDTSAGIAGYSNSNYGGYFSSNSSYSLVAGQSAAKPGGGSWSVFSDSRIKENIIPYTKGLADILLINTVTYEYNGLAGTTKGAKYTGVIAQEMKEIFPDTVKTYKAKLNEDDEEETELYDFNSSDLIFALINAVKELKAEIEILKAK